MLKTSSSAVTKRPRDGSCLSVVTFNSTKRRDAMEPDWLRIAISAYPPAFNAVVQV